MDRTIPTDVNALFGNLGFHSHMGFNNYLIVFISFSSPVYHLDCYHPHLGFELYLKSTACIIDLIYPAAFRILGCALTLLMRLSNSLTIHFLSCNLKQRIL
ncbi:hypothetical protein BO83DRAFT_198906 [Aspergillus eucalypticola CBS 122712]|uniref:Uncharacterized protein n=1 Tax=Aspergillus eucalypticola (strain CBS 122712 / IBT 29274) TaxID=1448314 RepID=A0A317VZX0_ASPEC|nr:uncharacterized protein BO83DRAFT_198906 [Aspergillus eucalypticola CBS 122712]PWY79924.1 hypothetical protein BO83DRAFT_198906 [Aspergillus eucalypticola CBS 122712]